MLHSLVWQFLKRITMIKYNFYLKEKKFLQFLAITKLWIKLLKIFIYNLSVGISFHFSCVKIYSGVPGSCIKGMFNFMWNVQTLFQRGVPFYIWTSNQVDKMTIPIAVSLPLSIIAFFNRLMITWTFSREEGCV